MGNDQLLQSASILFQIVQLEGFFRDHPCVISKFFQRTGKNVEIDRQFVNSLHQFDRKHSSFINFRAAPELPEYLCRGFAVVTEVEPAKIFKTITGAYAE